MSQLADIEKKIDEIARRVSSPKGKQARSDQHYNDKLLTRLSDKPVTYMPKYGFLTGYRRWASAACILVMCGFGYAMVSGIVDGWNFGWNNPEAENTMNDETSMTFANVSLGEVFGWIESRYGVTFNVTDPSLLSYHVTVEFRNDESLMTVMDVLADIGGFDYEQKGNEITIKHFYIY